MDLNELLRRTVTAPADGGAASEAWIRGKKRHARHTPAGAEAPTANNNTGPSSSHVEVVRMALQDAQREAAAAQQQARAETERLADAQTAGMAASVVEFVLQRELGGRYNSQRGGEEGCALSYPLPSELPKERATLIPAAASDTVVHVVSRSNPVVSRATREVAVAGRAAYRSALRLCDSELDLVGGWLAGQPPRVRRRLAATVEAGLRGEDYIPPAANLEADNNNSSTKQPSTELSLFAPSVADDVASHQLPKFSVDEFLRSSSPDSDADE